MVYNLKASVLSHGTQKKTADFLSGISTSADTKEFMSILFTGLSEIIPYDHSVQWYQAAENRGMRFYESFRTGTFSMNIVVDSLNNTRAVREFNEYYKYRQPPPERIEKYSYAVDHRQWENSEYYTDFIRPVRIRHSLVPIKRSLMYNFSIQRAGNPGFSDGEAWLAGLISDHVECIYSCLTKIEKLEGELYSRIDLDRLHCRLTPRESEIIRMILLRFSVEEIAAYLCISRRTVEAHIADVYRKLNIRSRYELFLLYSESEKEKTADPPGC